VHAHAEWRDTEEEEEEEESMEKSAGTLRWQARWTREHRPAECCWGVVSVLWEAVSVLLGSGERTGEAALTSSFPCASWS
jgi:hypothetical protein